MKFGEPTQLDLVYGVTGNTGGRANLPCKN